MKKYFYISIGIIVALAVILVGYGTWLNFRDEKEISRRMEERALQLVGAEARMRRIQPTFEMDAVRLYSEGMADAVALVDGRISEWYVSKNAVVKKGDTLLKLINEQIPLQIQQANSNVRRAQALMAQAANSFHRQERLMAKNATSKEKYEEAEAEYAAAREALAEAEAQREQYVIQSGRQEIKAPVDGNVLIIYHREGSYVQGGTPLALIGNFDRLLFAMTLEDKSARRLAAGGTIRVKIPVQSLQKAYDTEYAAGNKGRSETITATLREVTPSLGEPADMRRVLWEIDNRSHLLEPLTYNNVTVKADQTYDCLTVPLTAMSDSSFDSVFVVQPDKTVKRKTVRTGPNDGTFIEILSGLQENDVVVVENFEGLKDGVKVDVTLEGGSADGKGK